MALAKLKFGMAPSHPGDFIQGEVLEPLGLTVAKASEVLGVRRATLSDLLNEKTTLSPEMAMRIELAFGVKAEMLLGMQALWDAHAVRSRAAGLGVKRYNPAAA